MRISTADRPAYILEIEALPARLETEVAGLNDQQLDTPYRPNGWTLRQVVHHLADSHTHSYIRFKWALTENEPLIKAYDEKVWASLEDARTAPVEVSLQHLHGLHRRWVCLLRNIRDEEWSKAFIHPETNKKVPLYANLALYAWHCNHHLAHIANTKKKHGW